MFGLLLVLLLSSSCRSSAAVEASISTEAERFPAQRQPSAPLVAPLPQNQLPQAGVVLSLDLPPSHPSRLPPLQRRSPRRSRPSRRLPPLLGLALILKGVAGSLNWLSTKSDGMVPALRRKRSCS